MAPDPLRLLDEVLARGRRRLRLRGALRGLAAGAWVGALGAVGCGALRQVGLLDDLPAGIAAVAVLLASLAAGALIGAAWRTLADRQTALLLDRALGTDELLVTATWLRTRPPEPRRDRVLDELARAHLPPVSRALPLRLPRHLRWVAAPLAVAAVALLAPAWRPAFAVRAASSADPVVQEGARLAERLAERERPEGVELPEGLERQVSDLARDMQGEELSPEEALKRLEQIVARLAAAAAPLP